MASSDAERRIQTLEQRVDRLEAMLETQGGPTPAARAPQQDDEPELVTVVLKKKYFQHGEYGDDHIWMDLALTLNRSSKATRAIKGSLEFCDLFGEPQLTLGYTLNEPLTPGKATTVEGVGFDFNEFMSEHQWMLGTRIDDMVVRFSPRNAMFQDGTTVKF